MESHEEPGERERGKMSLSMRALALCVLMQILHAGMKTSHVVSSILDASMDWATPSYHERSFMKLKSLAPTAHTT